MLVIMEAIHNYDMQSRSVIMTSKYKEYIWNKYIK